MEKLIQKLDDIQDSSDEFHRADEEVKEAENVNKYIEEEVKALEEVIENKGIDGLRQTLRENSNKWKDVVVQIAVTGSCGAGKSAFINAIRGINASDKGGAKVGVKEQTTTLTPYTHPKNSNFIVWDMPGVGTEKFPRNNYKACVEFDRYDFFMLISKDRFTEDDLWLAQQIQEQKKRFYFIRTSIDTDIRNNSRAYPDTHSSDSVMREVRNDCFQKLVAAGIESPLVFLVDNHDRCAYDFGRLEVQLPYDCDSLKIEAIALSLSVLTKDILKKKKEVLEKRIDAKAMEIACQFDDEPKQKEMFEEEMSLYQVQFNFDEVTLRANRDILHFSEENLRNFQTICNKLTTRTATQLRTCLELSSGSPRSIKRTLKRLVWKWRAFFRKDAHSLTVLQFSCAALLQNLEEMYEMALEIYALKTQKGLVKSAMQYDGKKENDSYV